MDDTIRLDVADYDKEYIQEALHTLLKSAAGYGRTLTEIRMSKMMFDRLAIEQDRTGTSFKGVRVVVGDTGFEGTIEVTLAPRH